ncbi:MAG: biotin--[acetyl-CoA-carboxylase] ligase [Ilumatobacteraceae bacterium]
MTSADANWLDWPNGWWVEHVAETTSTNTDLYERAIHGAPAHTVIAADFQTAGRGRLDRTWEAVRGANLLVSLLFRGTSRSQFNFTQIVGLAAARACEQLVGVRPSLKWPNDLLVNNRKLSGLLAVGGPDFVVVGIGINVNWAPDGATALSEMAPESRLHPADLLRLLLVNIDQLEQLSTDVVHELYSASLTTIGTTVRVDRADRTVLTGCAVSVKRDGRLAVVDERGVTHLIDTGDIVHLRTT